MKRTVFQKLTCLVLSATILSGLLATTAFAANGSATGGYRPELDEMKSYLSASSYDGYLEEYRDAQGKLPVPALPAGMTEYTVDVVGDLKTGEYDDYDAVAKDSNGQDVAGGYTNGELSYGIVVSDSKYCQASMQDNEEAWLKFKCLTEAMEDPNVAQKTVYLSSGSEATWNLDVPASGMYYIRIRYFNCDTAQSGISSIERQLLINGAIPFTEVSSIKLNKTWKYDYVTIVGLGQTSAKDSVVTEYKLLDDGESFNGFTSENGGYYKFVTVVEGGVKSMKVYHIAEDINGNSIKPDMVQDPQWSTYYVQDTSGYYNDYFSFYFQEGANTLSLKAQREPMIIGGIELVPIESDAAIPSYKEFITEHGFANKKPVSGNAQVKIEAEFPDYTSDNSIVVGSDNSSSATQPASPSSQLYNTIGKLSYNSIGQWAAYTFRVNETGLYKMSMRYKQNALQGMYVCRALKLEGGIYGDTPTVPFLEAYDTQFDFSDEWQSTYLGAPDAEGKMQEFQFYFEAGTEYTLYLECSLGSLRDLIKDVEDAMKIMNDCYLRILQLTGATPDPNFNYKFHETLPAELIALTEQAKVLDRTARAFEALCGTKGSHIATLDTVALLLHNMTLDYGEQIASNLSNLKSYLGTLGTWINDSKRSMLIVDSLTLHSVSDGEKQLPKAKPGFFGSIWFEIRSFFASFFTDYDNMGLTEEPTKDSTSVEVWLASGRDQSTIWRSLIDSEAGFTNQTGKAVQLKLVAAGTLLPSILADKGPDVYLGLTASEVINYAIRDAIVGINGKVEYDEDKRMDASDVEALNKVFTSTYYTYKVGNEYKEYAADKVPPELKKNATPTFTSVPYDEITAERYVPAAMDTLRLMGVYYGIPSGMGFAMMFYRSDILAELGTSIPKTWTELMGLLPDMQANNMAIGLTYTSAIDFILYQSGGSMWRFADRTKEDYHPDYEGALIGLDTNVAKAAFKWVTRLYTEFSFDVSFDVSNRFRTGEMPIVISEYTATYNTLVVYATELNGLWGFCSLPGWEHEEDDGTIRIDYSSICGVSATVLLHGYSDALSSWQFMQWQTREDIQSEYGNGMVALLGPSAKYESANIHALEGMSWTAEELTAIRDQMNNLYSVVNYPGSYIIARYTNFAFLSAVNDRADPVEALMGYIDAINEEIIRKRTEFGLPTIQTPEALPKT